MRFGELYFDSSNTEYPTFQIFYSRTEPEQRKHYIEHHHTECEISLIVSGECQWCVNDRVYRGQAGDVYIFGSNENHYLTEIFGQQPLILLNIRFESRVIWSFGSDQFNLRYLTIFLGHGQYFSNAIGQEDVTARTIAQLMQEIYEECQNCDSEYRLIVKAKFMLLLATLGRYYKISQLPSVPSSYSQHLSQLDQAISFIDENLTQELSLERIARAAGMSKSYFSAIFKQMNGIPAWEYITRKRVELAMQLLRNRELSIMTIAEQCGFTSISNFNRCFKEVTSFSPSVYRKEFSSDDRTPCTDFQLNIHANAIGTTTNETGSA